MPHSSVWNSHPKKNSKGGRTCRKCKNHGGIHREFNLGLCRQCFRELAADIGFQKFR